MVAAWFLLLVVAAGAIDYTVDLSAATTAWNHYWSKCVGSGHGTLTLREDWRQHLTQAHQELGFEYVRFHGMLDDDMSTSMDQGLNSYVNVDSFVDFLISIGMKPIFELSFMPTWLASGTDTVCHYKGNITPPKSYSQWHDVIKSLAQHLVDRYGVDAVTQWPFEVWNEPGQGPTFWTGTQQDYWDLYNASAVAIKSVNVNLKVGGPVCATCTCWITDFINYMKANGIPYDFISTHCYSGGSTDIGSVPNIVSGLQQARGLIGSSTPFYVTEWGSTYIQGTGNGVNEGDYHDIVDQAPFVVAAIEQGYGYADIFSYWTFSDIFEEAGFPTGNISFHGGFGLMAIYQIPKPTYRAFQLLAETGTDRVKVTKPQPVCTQTQGVDYYGYDLSQAPATDANACCNMCAQNTQCKYYSFQVSEQVCMLKTSNANQTSNPDRISGGLQNADLCLTTTNIVAVLNKTGGTSLLMLIYNHATQGTPIQDCTVAVTLNTGSFKASGSATIRKIDQTHANPKQAWINMGMPWYLTQSQITQLQTASQLVSESFSISINGNTVTFSTSVPSHGLQAIRIPLN